MNFGRLHFIAFCAMIAFAEMLTAPDAVFAQTSKDAETVMTVTLSTVRMGILQNTLEAHGKATPRDDVVVATDIAGVNILGLYAEEGDSVEKGQELARLDPASLQFALDSLLADLAKTKMELNRARELQKANAISREILDQREAAHLVLLAEVADARLRLQKTVIVAPASGVIYQRDAIIGEVTQTNQPLFRIAARGEIELEVAVPETFAHAITLETPVEASLAGDTEKKPANVRMISPRIDPLTRTANVRLIFPAPSFIPVNTFCTALFSLPPKDGLIAPATAILRDAQGTYAWLIRDDNTIERRNVTIVARNGGFMLIEGLEKNQRIVTRAGAFLQEGDLISPASETKQ